MEQSWAVKQRPLIFVALDWPKVFYSIPPPFDACFTPVWVPNAQLPFDPTIYSERTFAVFDGSLEIIET